MRIESANTGLLDERVNILGMSRLVLLHILSLRFRYLSAIVENIEKLTSILDGTRKLNALNF